MGFATRTPHELEGWLSPQATFRRWALRQGERAKKKRPQHHLYVWRPTTHLPSRKPRVNSHFRISNPTKCRSWCDRGHVYDKSKNFADLLVCLSDLIFSVLGGIPSGASPLKAPGPHDHRSGQLRSFQVIEGISLSRYSIKFRSTHDLWLHRSNLEGSRLVGH